MVFQKMFTKYFFPATYSDVSTDRLARRYPPHVPSTTDQLIRRYTSKKTRDTQFFQNCELYNYLWRCWLALFYPKQEKDQSR